jgi:hypothetical protein
MSAIELSTEGLVVASGGNNLVVSNITPADGVQPGAAGGFSADFSTARRTPLQFDITGIPSGAQIMILCKFSDRDETYVALDADGNWQWPFDVVGPDDNQIGSLTSEPVAVQILPRGGFRSGGFSLTVVSAFEASYS